jgi:hypothetical protein
VKNDRNIFKLQSEPRSCDSREDHSTRLIKYDDQMRQEEKKYSRPLTKLNNPCLPIRHASKIWDGVALPTNDGFTKYGLNKQSAFAKNDVNQAMDEDLSSDLKTTRLTDDEILYGSGLTMEQEILRKKKPSVLHTDDRTSVQHAMVLQCALSSQERNNARSVRIEMNQAAFSNKLESNGRESLPSESVMAESVGLVLQRWRGVCSFSVSTLCGGNEDDIDETNHLSSEKHVERRE